MLFLRNYSICIITIQLPILWAWNLGKKYVKKNKNNIFYNFFLYYLKMVSTLIKNLEKIRYNNIIKNRYNNILHQL